MTTRRQQELECIGKIAERYSAECSTHCPRTALCSLVALGYFVPPATEPRLGDSPEPKTPY